MPSHIFIEWSDLFNGKFERTDLLREELNFNGIFNSQEIGSLIKDLEERF